MLKSLLRLPSNFQRCGALVWASPWTLVGCVVGGVSLVAGGGVQIVDGVIEFYGGVLPWLLRRIPIAGGAAAMTLGHSVIAKTQSDLHRTRDHERIHVRQYERWGPLFVPAYAAASAIVWIQGGDAYRDNAFEREAYDGSTTCSVQH